jgi:Tfp pilus assembly protein PilF
VPTAAGAPLNQDNGDGGNSAKVLTADGGQPPGVRSPDEVRPYLDLAIEKLAQGDAKAACVAASEACHRAPQDQRAHYAYGEAWLALSEPARAEQAFAAALQLDPAWVDAWINYGVARYRQGAIDDAKQAMREALLRQPGHPAAAANLGAFMRISGENESGEAAPRSVRTTIGVIS